MRLACAFLAVILGAAPAAADPVVLHYGQAFSAVRSIYSLPIFVADREGFFTREGLDFSNILIPGGGGKMIAALEDGTVEITHVATPFLISSDLAGADAVAIAAEFDNPIYSLVAKPEIRGYADLKGRVLGLADEAGTIAYSTWKLLAANGVRPADLEVKTVSGTPQRLACLTGGTCDAVPLGQPEDFEALAKGYRRLGVTTDAVPAFVYTVTAARRSWAKAHKDVVVRYLRALAASFRFIRDPAHRDQVVRIIVATEAVSAASARATLRLYFEPERNVLPRAGEIDPDGIRQVIDFMAAQGALKPPLPPVERFIDPRYLRAAGIGG
ncbi:MAG TPA: ABC transporter substrate-binding protein [Stellaceae bacterium]|nr:ABC transporter substrate-binding protein [Stellaceae bacterium]